MVIPNKIDFKLQEIALFGTNFCEARLLDISTLLFNNIVFDQLTSNWHSMNNLILFLILVSALESYLVIFFPNTTVPKKCTFKNVLHI